MKRATIVIGLGLALGCAGKHWIQRSGTTDFDRARGLCQALTGAPPVGNTYAMTDYTVRYTGCMNAQGWFLERAEK